MSRSPARAAAPEPRPDERRRRRDGRRGPGPRPAAAPLLSGPSGDELRRGIVALSERVHRLCETALAPGGIRALSTWRPMSLAAFRLVQSLHQEGMSFATVLDVGANVGQFARASLGRWPGVHVIAFEPDPDVAARLGASLGKAGRVEVHALAVGSEDGTAAFFPHAHRLSSSLLPVADGVRGEPWARELTPLTVPRRQLDSVLAGRTLERPCLLKIDAQGLELDVVTAATATLEQVDAVLVEAAFEPRYAGQPRFSQVHQTLLDLGWELLRPLDFNRGADGRILEADLLYTAAGKGV